MDQDVVIAADVAVRPRRAVAALRRRGAVGVYRRGELVVPLRRLALALRRLLVREDERRPGGTLERRQGAEVISALKVWMAVRHPFYCGLGIGDCGLGLRLRR